MSTFIKSLTFNDGICTAASNGNPNLATDVTGILPVANGGTNTATPSIVAGTGISVTGTWPNQTITATGGFSNPMTTLGDIIYENATPAATRLAGNTTSTKKFLTQTGTGSVSAAPGWSTIAAADMPVFVASGASHAPGAVPDPGASAGTTHFLREDATWAVPPNSGGTVTSVALSLPSFITVSGSPVTTTGTLTGTLATQTANTVFAGPTSGSAAAPTFRNLSASDLPPPVMTAVNLSLFKGNI